MQRITGCLKKEKQMKKIKLILAAFVLIALVQIYVPARMILDREDVLSTGKEYKFRVAPVDPVDPFRGKYITLRYLENMIVDETENGWGTSRFVYVILNTDSAGFAKIHSILKDEPMNNQDYFRANVKRIWINNSFRLTINVPFDRYYMEESKANTAEEIYRESLSDTNKVAYSLVSIKHGEAVLKDVIIDGTSIKELVKKKMTP